MSALPPFRIGSRRSLLARTQAEWVAQRIEGCTAMVWIRSEGDDDTTRPLTSFGGVGAFTATLHRALREDRCDGAVHSLKDLPAGAEDGIVLACVPVREDPRDAWLSREGARWEEIPAGARVGTGSPRRMAQLRRLRPDLNFVPIRGNVDTRLEKLAKGEGVDALVLAVAGLRRLGREQAITEILDPSVCLPAAGQGALGITVRAGHAAAEGRLAGLRDVRAAATTAAERAALHALGAGCHAPVGALGTVVGGRLHLVVRLVSLDGAEELSTQGEAGLGEATQLGEAAARELLQRGGGRWLKTQA